MTGVSNLEDFKARDPFFRIVEDGWNGGSAKVYGLAPGRTSPAS
jgi:hypothetical protein